jgi:hypothetical protein
MPPEGSGGLVSTARRCDGATARTNDGSSVVHAVLLSEEGQRAGGPGGARNTGLGTDRTP